MPCHDHAVSLDWCSDCTANDEDTERQAKKADEWMCQEIASAARVTRLIEAGRVFLARLDRDSQAGYAPAEVFRHVLDKESQ